VRVNRGLFNWGVFLLAAGVVALGFRAGLLTAGAFGELGRLWPVALIALGVIVLAGYFLGSRVGGAVVALLLGIVVGAFLGGGAGAIGCPEPSDGRAVAGSERGTLGSSASVNVRVACGELELAGQSGNQWLAQNNGDPREARVTTSESQLTFAAARTRGFPFRDDDRSGPDWRLTLPAMGDLDVRMELNAGQIVGALPVRLARLSATVNGGALRADLHEATIGALSVTVNAGSVAIELPPNASFSGSVTTNAGAFTLCLPRDTPIRIRQSGGAGSNNFAEFGLMRSGNAWESSTYATAANRIDLSMTVNAGSASLEVPGECG
jgi:hypothetical protein